MLVSFFIDFTSESGGGELAKPTKAQLHGWPSGPR
jgi:hypothetical protein